MRVILLALIQAGFGQLHDQLHPSLLTTGESRRSERHRKQDPNSTPGTEQGSGNQNVEGKYEQVSLGDGLGVIDSVECLEKRKKDRNADCSAKEKAESATPQHHGSIVVHDMGNYPSWRDAVCHSENEAFCDPDGLLTGNQTKEVIDRLQRFRSKHQVTCPAALERGTAGYDVTEKFQFILGVAIMHTLPDSELDDISLDHFGNKLMVNWNMYGRVNGHVFGCPSAALIVVVASAKKAVVVTPSCEFLCRNRGATDAELTMEARLVDMPADSEQANSEDDRALASAILHQSLMDGIDRVEDVMKANGMATETLQNMRHFDGRTHELDVLRFLKSDSTWTASQLIVGGVFLFAVVSILIAMIWNLCKHRDELFNDHRVVITDKNDIAYPIPGRTDYTTRFNV